MMNLGPNIHFTLRAFQKHSVQCLSRDQDTKAHRFTIFIWMAFKPLSRGNTCSRKVSDRNEAELLVETVNWRKNHCLIAPRQEWDLSGLAVLLSDEAGVRVLCSKGAHSAKGEGYGGATTQRSPHGEDSVSAATLHVTPYTQNQKCKSASPAVKAMASKKIM